MRCTRRAMDRRASCWKLPSSWKAWRECRKIGSFRRAGSFKFRVETVVLRPGRAGGREARFLTPIDERPLREPSFRFSVITFASIVAPWDNPQEFERRPNAWAARIFAAAERFPICVTGPMKASDILHRLTQAVRQLPSSRRNVAAAAVVATVMGAVAGLAWPRLTGGGHEGVSSFPRAILDNGVGPVPNREAKGGLSHGAGDSIGAEALAPASGPPAPEQQATAETAAPAATTGATVTADAPQPTNSPPPAETPAVPKIPPAKVAATGAVAEQSQATSASGAPTSAQAPISDNPLDRLARGGSVQTPPAAQPASPPQAPPPGQVPPPSDGERKLAAIAGPPQQPEAPSYPPADPREVAAALGPMLARQPGAEDIEALKEAVRLVQKEDFDGARAAYNKISGKTVRKLAYWYYLRSSNANVRPNEIAAFRNANPHWPGRDTLDERAEKSLILHMASWQETFDFFHNRKPTTGAGKAALGAALIAKGEKEQGVRLVREAWRQHVLDDELEAKLLERFSGILTEADHKNRADFLSFKSKRSKVAVVLRHQQPAAKPGRQTPGKPLTPGKTLGAQLSTARSPARLLARINLLRKQDKHQEAWALLRASPKDAGGSGADWWPERRLQARNALNRGQAKIAYAIVLGHGPLEAEMQAEAGFMAGWIALRFLNDPATARQHLIGATHAGGLPKDLARSYYWLARAEIVLSKKADAQAHFVEASRHQHTFYGQLARTALTAIGAGPKSPRISLRAPARPTAEDIRAFQDLDFDGGDAHRPEGRAGRPGPAVPLRYGASRRQPRPAHPGGGVRPARGPSERQRALRQGGAQPRLPAGALRLSGGAAAVPGP